MTGGAGRDLFLGAGLEVLRLQWRRLSEILEKRWEGIMAGEDFGDGCLTVVVRRF